MIFKYGIKLIWPGGPPEHKVVGFSPSGYQTWKTTIGIGTRMLLYETAASDLLPDAVGSMAIIGEAEVTGPFYKDPLGAPSPQHYWLVPVQTIRTIPSVQPIQLSDISKIVPGFHQPHETWRGLSDDQYDALTRLF